MPRSIEDNRAIKDKRKTAILTAALSLFAKSGYLKTTFSDIAKESGLSRPLIYHYYQTKDEVWNDISKASLSFYLPPYEEAMTQKGFKGLSQILSFFEEEGSPDEMTILFEMLQMDRHFEPFNKREGDKLFGPDPFEIIASLLQEAAIDGQVHYGDYKAMAETLLDSLRGYLSRRLRYVRMKKKTMAYPSFSKDDLLKSLS